MEIKPIFLYKHLYKRSVIAKHEVHTAYVSRLVSPEL
jgi:hypothetical protein